MIDKKREEIREALAELSYYNAVELGEIARSWDAVKTLNPDIADVHYSFANKYLAYLHSQGVVIKVRDALDLEDVDTVLSVTEPLIKG